jgi:hypothetical protein
MIEGVFFTFFFNMLPLAPNTSKEDLNFEGEL